MAPSFNLVASTAPLVEARYFDDPRLDGPSPLIVEGDHVYGHLATWKDANGNPSCHIGIKGVCTTPPTSEHAYAYFRTGSVHTDKGRISVGQITMDTNHASLDKNARAAASHYDHTGTVVADVAAGEDEYGIWISGRVRPGISDEQRHALAAGALSGDWRNIGGNLELVAALVVNVPGFPIPRPALAASAGEQTSLVAAGITTKPGDGIDIAALAAAVDDYNTRKQQRVAKVASARTSINRERIDRMNQIIKS